MSFSSKMLAAGGRIVRDIRKVAVLGAGTMGARLAAQLANASVPCLLLDIVPKELTRDEQAKGLALDSPRVRNRLAQAGLDAALKSRPAAFFVPESARLITIGNLEDDLTKLKDCDWIIEAVMEDLAVKRALLDKVQAVRSPGSIVSSNTSGISISSLSAGFSEDFAGTSWALTFSIHRATCTCWRSSPRRKRCRGWWTRFRALATWCWAKALW